MGIIIGLLVLWLILSVVGFTVKGLIWLAIIGLVLFVVTGIFGFIRRKASGAA
jgi:LPXTG-motif cell wall-anchored protein